MSARTCGCDPEANWICERHRRAWILAGADMYAALKKARRILDGFAEDDELAVIDAAIAKAEQS